MTIMLIMVPRIESDVTLPLDAVIGGSLLFVLGTVLATPTCEGMRAVPPSKQHSSFVTLLQDDTTTYTTEELGLFKWGIG